ncbi:hypothetical protein BDW62DRAFT_189859, partial [Aspergillus aurantiobrunneus]
MNENSPLLYSNRSNANMPSISDSVTISNAEYQQLVSHKHPSEYPYADTLGMI